MSVALLEAVKEQSFLATSVDLASAVDGPNPERNISKVMARTATLFVPNVFKSIDKFLSPEVQQAEGFFENFIKEVPFARWGLNPSLNRFGQPIERMKGLIPLPSLENIATMQKTDDPVLNLISEKMVKIPGISKSTRIGNRPIGEYYYEYVQIAGSRFYDQIKANITYLRTLDKEQLEDQLESMDAQIKREARREIETKYSLTKEPKGSGLEKQPREK
jgi:hypothetical protein